MAGETTLTIIGNTTGPAELRSTPVSRGFGKTEGTPVANFTVASTPRTFDPASNSWVDGETLFLRCSAWRELAENTAETLTDKGMRVVVTGKLKQRSYDKDGQTRTVIELEVEEVGPSLRYATAKVARKANDIGGGQRAGGTTQPSQSTGWGSQPASTGWGGGDAPF